MPRPYDILIKNGSLRDKTGQTYDIGIRDGKIVEIHEGIKGQANVEIDAAGDLVTESFVNPHLHLCKVYTLQELGDGSLEKYHGLGMGKSMAAIEAAAKAKETYSVSSVLRNARRAIALSALNGVTHIRAFADVDTTANLVAVEALIKAREEFTGVVALQVVAFPQEGIIREPGAEDLLRESMRIGADIVGGIPWIEFTETEILKHVKCVFEIAEEYDAPISMLVDDAGDPGLRSLEMMAVETIRRGWNGRTLAHHARAMSLYPEPYFQKVAALLRQAQLGVVSDPHTGPLHARVVDLLENGCLVSLGQDDISDAYYPYGRGNMLEVAFLASHLLWMMTRNDMSTLFDMITLHAARSIGLSDFGLAVGSTANLVVLGQRTIVDAFRVHEMPRHVISHGRVLERERLLEYAKPPAP